MFPCHTIESLLNRRLHRWKITPLQILPCEHSIHRDRRHRFDRQIHAIGVAHQNRILIDLLSRHLDKPLPHRFDVSNLFELGRKSCIKPQTRGRLSIILSGRSHVDSWRYSVEFHSLTFAEQPPEKRARDTTYDTPPPEFQQSPLPPGLPPHPPHG